MKHDTDTKSDLEECKEKIKSLLKEYNCTIESSYDYSFVYIQDYDTGESSPLHE